MNSCFNDFRHLVPQPFGIRVIDDFCDGVNKVKINPKEYPFHIGYSNFKTRAEAETFAKKRAGETGDDVVISQRVAVVKFPVPDLKVEELVVS